MNGPSEFHVIGTLKGWDITPRLGDVQVPVLVISGEHDEATPAVVRPLVDALPTRGGSSSRAPATRPTSSGPSGSSSS